MCQFAYILQLGKNLDFDMRNICWTLFIMCWLALLDPLDEVLPLGWDYLVTWKANIIFFKDLTYFLFCLSVAAIILVATIYYYSQPVGTITWIRALLYPSCVQYNIGLVLNLHFVRPKTWSISSLIWWFFRYCAVAPTVLAGQIDPVLFEALYVSSIFYFLVCTWTYVAGVCHSSLFSIAFLLIFIGMLIASTCISNVQACLDFFSPSVKAYWVFLMRKWSVTGISACYISLRQDPTNMEELFCKLNIEGPIMLLNWMLLVVGSHIIYLISFFQNCKDSINSFC